MSLQDKVAQAWVNCARTGNPSQPGLEWKPYAKQNPQAMVFDTVSESVPLADDRLVSLLPPGGGRGGTAPTSRSAAAPGGRG
jgi:para-nitrobenzyl esterase